MQTESFLSVEYQDKFAFLFVDVLVKCNSKLKGLVSNGLVEKDHVNIYF